MYNDSIYRQDAINILEVRLKANGYSNAALVSELNRSIKYMIQLPPAQSKRKGKWIEIMDVDEFGNPYSCGVQCSECGFCSVNLDNYCPDCGSYNGEEEKEKE